MDDIQPEKTPAEPDLAELRSGIESLRNLVFTILGLVVIVSATLNIYLLRQVRYAHRDLEGIRAQATQLISEYQKTSGPIMDKIIQQFAEYGRTHPDFAPIMNKYGIKPTVVPASPGPASPVPTPPPATPKK